MKIRSIKIRNYRIFEKLQTDFHPRLTVFVGANGSGKTSILDALAIPLKMIGDSGLRYPTKSLPTDDVRISPHVQCAETQTATAQITYEFCDIDTEKAHFFYDVYYKPPKQAIETLNHIGRFNDCLDNGVKPVVVCYGARRAINSYARKSGAHAEYEYAFKNAFEAGIDFASTISWFIEKTAEEAMKGKRKGEIDYILPELEATRIAVSKMLGDYNKPYVDGTPNQIYITHVTRPDAPLKLQQLSDGCRTMLAMIMDLARRMALAAQAKGFKNVLDYPAIVLIDEVELHLHPSWQQRVLPSLLELFPNAQFITATHSPQIIASIKPEQIRILTQNGVRQPETSTYGAESQRILEEIFGVSPRYAENEAKKTLDAYLQLINRGEYDTCEAKAQREKLDDWLNNDPALDLADMMIRRALRKNERERGSA